MTQLLYLGVYYYRTSRYNQVISIVELFLQPLIKPFFWLQDNVLERRQCFDRVSTNYLGDWMKKTWVESIYISGPITFMDEIDLEYHENMQTLPNCIYVHVRCLSELQTK